MKVSATAFAVIGVLAWGGAAAQYSYAPFPAAESRQNTPPVSSRQVPGCDCGTKTVAVPSSITTRVGTPVTLRYDASNICQGQTVRDLNGKEFGKGFASAGKVQWEIGAVQTLPDAYGVATYDKGYSQAGSSTATVTVSVQCYDVGAKCKSSTHYNVCTATGTVPVNIVP